MSSSCCGPSEQKTFTGWKGWLSDVQTILTACCGLFLLVALATGSYWVAGLSALFGSYFALKSAWESLRERSVDVNLLMVIAAAGAIAIGEIVDAAGLLFLFSLSSTLESIAMAKARSAIDGLVRLRPSQAIRITEGKDEQVAVESLEVGDRIRIPAFESVPVDAEVISGSSQVDQSAMTGESIPVARSPGDALLAGTQNLEGSLIASVTHKAGDSTLDKIVALVQDAQDNKASGERISHWFGQSYTFFVLGAFITSLLVRLLLFKEPVHLSLLTSLTLLVALSPCALVISTPATTLSALTWAARKGILVRGGSFIEAAGRVTAVVLDKTGTLTAGKPELQEICLCSHAHAGFDGPCVDEHKCWRGTGEMSAEAGVILRAAASAEQYSVHPIAEAILRAARSHDIDVPEAMNQQTAPGLGVSAMVEGKLVHVGKLSHMPQASSNPEFVQHVRELEGRGLTVALISYGDELAALGFRDEPRAEASAFLSTLSRLKISKILMLTGDNEATAKSVATRLGIGEVGASLMPHQKTQRVQELAGAGEIVMMVGDGINDAPSLASASVGVAMGGLGSDIALNSADVVLMNDRLERIPELIELGRRTNRIIMANLLFAVGVILVLTVASLFTKLPLPLAVVGHEGSTVLVILNGLRLLRGPGKIQRA